MVSLVCETNMAIGLGTDYFCKNASEKPADLAINKHSHSFPVPFSYYLKGFTKCKCQKAS